MPIPYMPNNFCFSFLVVCAAICASPVFPADNFSIEDGFWKPAPVNAAALVQHYEGDALAGCKPLQIRKLPGATTLYVVTTQDSCWGNSTAPLWVVELDRRPRVLLNDGGFVVGVKLRRTGKPDIVITSGNAGHCYERRWHFESGAYTVVSEANCL